MIDFSKWAFRNRNLVYFFIAVLVVGGVLSCWQMSKLEDPEVKVKLAMVVTTYPGASAHQVELEVTDVLEKKIRTMGNINSIEKNSVVAVTYGDKWVDDAGVTHKSEYKTFLLNYNSYAVRLTYNGNLYTIPAGGYIAIYR